MTCTGEAAPSRPSVMVKQKSTAGYDLFSAPQPENHDAAVEAVSDTPSSIKTGSGTAPEKVPLRRTAKAKAHYDASLPFETGCDINEVESGADPPLRRSAEDDIPRPVLPRQQTKRSKSHSSIPSNSSSNSGPPVRFLRVREVADLLGIGVSTIWRWLKRNPDFPRPVHLSNGSTRWRVADLEAYDRALGSHYPTKALHDASPADMARQSKAEPPRRDSDGGGHRQRRKR